MGSKQPAACVSEIKAHDCIALSHAVWLQEIRFVDVNNAAVEALEDEVAAQEQSSTLLQMLKQLGGGSFCCSSGSSCCSGAWILSHTGALWPQCHTMANQPCGICTDLPSLNRALQLNMLLRQHAFYLYIQCAAYCFKSVLYAVDWLYVNLFKCTDCRSAKVI